MIFKVVWFSKDAERESDCFVVIDVFRTSSFIVTALHLGAKEVIPVKSVKQAFGIKRRKEVVLSGESRTKKIKGFDIGNSPYELREKRDLIKEKSLVHRSGAGTQVLSSISGNVVVGSVLNAKAVADHIFGSKFKRVCFVCAGLDNRHFAIEDLYGVNCIIEQMKMDCDPENDFAILSKCVTEEMVRRSEGAKRLRSCGYEKDINLCLQKNAFEIVPTMKNGRIR
jgi:Phosphosulfolactate phosphohydrolase and related enzymes